MPSSPQTVTTRGVFDYLKTPSNKAIVGATVNCTLNFNAASVTSPIVNLGEVQQSTVTDQNGFWRFDVTPNDTITPSGTLYTISTPNSSYDISVPSGGADVQSSSILANTPSVLSPAITGLTGPITVTGNETVTGNLSVSGTTTLGSTTAGATTLGATTVGGDLTIGSAFRLLINTAVSKLVPGSTSFSHRNNADSADNLLITDAGAVTVRNGFTLTAGDAVITAGRLLISAAAAKILGGATSLSLRNNADSADNLLITDAGAITLRHPNLLIPVTAGGTTPPTGAGVLAYKYDEQTPTGASVTIPASGSIPSGFRHIYIEYFCPRTSNASATALLARLNNDSTANYNVENVTMLAAVLASALTTGATSFRVSGLPGTDSGASVIAHGSIWITAYANSSTKRGLRSYTWREDSGGVGTEQNTGEWNNTTNAVTSVVLLPGAGNFGSGTLITTYLIP